MKINLNLSDCIKFIRKKCHYTQEELILLAKIQRWAGKVKKIVIWKISPSYNDAFNLAYISPREYNERLTQDIRKLEIKRNRGIKSPFIFSEHVVDKNNIDNTIESLKKELTKHNAAICLKEDGHGYKLAQICLLIGQHLLVEDIGESRVKNMTPQKYLKQAQIYALNLLRNFDASEEIIGKVKKYFKIYLRIFKLTKIKRIFRDIYCFVPIIVVLVVALIFIIS